jgi:hypothetical protein
MKQIMRLKKMANTARKDLDAGANLKPRDKRSDETHADGNGDGDGVDRTVAKNNNKATNNSVSLSLDGKDTSVGTMLGNHLNESTLDQEQSSDLAITSAQYMRGTDGQSQLSCGDDRSGDGASGVLSFLGESPLFDRSVTEEDEAERTLSRDGHHHWTPTDDYEANSILRSLTQRQPPPLQAEPRRRRHGPIADRPAVNGAGHGQL